MSEYNDLLSLVGGPTKESFADPQKEQKIGIVPANLFDIEVFAEELRRKSENKNRGYLTAAKNINAYDVANNCIRQIVYKLSGTPIKSYADRWLPIFLRTALGSAVHNFLQENTKQFTEQEVSLKVPSLKFSGRLDALIGNNILIEIKSMPYDEYEKAIRTNTPRNKDFIQALLYVYMLENHIDEIKQSHIKVRPGSTKPALDYYKITKLQFIYVAHDIMTSDFEDLGTNIKKIDEFKRRLNSRRNPFFFINSIVLDMATFDSTEHIKFIESKIKRINYYVDSNTLPSDSDEFVNKNCYLCLYRDICDIVK